MPSTQLFSRFVLLAFAVIMTVSGCQKDEEPDPAPQPQKTWYKMRYFVDNQSQWWVGFSRWYTYEANAGEIGELKPSPYIEEELFFPSDHIGSFYAYAWDQAPPGANQVGEFWIVPNTNPRWAMEQDTIHPDTIEVRWTITLTDVDF